MDEIAEKKNKAEKLAEEVLILSRNTLLVNLRFLDLALNRLPLVPAEGTTIRTDARQICYDPMHILKCYKAEREIPARDLLHMVMHCVFRHMFTDPGVDHACWDLACDIAVENVISGLRLKPLAASRETAQSVVLEDLKQRLTLITAEKVYAYLLNDISDKTCFAKLQELFRADDHQFWYPPDAGALKEHPEEETDAAETPGEENTDDTADDGASDPDDTDPVGDSAGSGDAASKLPDENLSPDPSGSLESLSDAWKEIAEKLQTDLETFSKEQGDKAGALMQNLNEVNREKADYAAFLRKFASRSEVMKIDDDEFDYIFYTYGLKLYENMPLVEPLEYREIRQIKEFVIAIDTSGSTSGELVQRFVEKTYSILKSTETFSTRINLHIIQCDAEIQEHVKITGQEEFDDWLSHMVILGQGGTDFRPVFRMVDRMIAEKEFRDLRGMLYFTDGYGIFPSAMPAYETAFVFLNDSYDSPAVPPWAIRLVLQKDEI